MFAVAVRVLCYVCGACWLHVRWMAFLRVRCTSVFRVYIWEEYISRRGFCNVRAISCLVPCIFFVSAVCPLCLECRVFLPCAIDRISYLVSKYSQMYRCSSSTRTLLLMCCVNWVPDSRVNDTPRARHLVGLIGIVPPKCSALMYRLSLLAFILVWLYAH